MQLTARELAVLLQGTIEGDPEVLVDRPSKIEDGGEGSISFLANLKYEEYAYKTNPSILIVDRNFKPRKPLQSTLIRVEDVYASIALLMNKFGQSASPTGVISDQAFIHPTSEIGQGVSVGPFSIIEAESVIGNSCYIFPQVYIGKNVQIGDNVTLFPGVKVMDHSRIGNHCVLQPNVVIGSDGFGFAPLPDGSYTKIAHTGNVILEDEVEIGSNTTIDRASIGSTIIKRGAKLDNLIQIGHSAEIGEHTVIAAQAGVAGSAKIGKSCRIGGQAGFVGHINVADGTEIQAQSGVAGPVKQPNTKLFGSPAIPYGDYVRSYVVFKKLPELYKKINELEKRLNQK